MDVAITRKTALLNMDSRWLIDSVHVWQILAILAALMAMFNCQELWVSPTFILVKDRRSHDTSRLIINFVVVRTGEGRG
jgi:hypothetical protein